MLMGNGILDEVFMRNKMPNLREHHAFTIKKYGKATAERYKFVHRLLDSAQPTLGKLHRKLFHDEVTMRFIGTTYGWTAEMIARDHWRMDGESTNRKNKAAREKYKREKDLNKKGGKNKK